MSQPRRSIEQLLHQGRLPLQHADEAAIELEVYPSQKTWLAFFDKAALIIGAIALVLSLVFFIAYNWQHLGKMGKFALVEGALVLTIALYVTLSFRKRFELMRQLLLCIASIITGSLLALFGQVYQTGPDTWQLFFGWAVLIIPWVIIARLPALWLLWLGLVNVAVLQYITVTPFLTNDYPYVIRMGTLALINTVMLGLWMSCVQTIALHHSGVTVSAKQHWSVYVVGLLSTYFMTHFAVIYIIGYINAPTAVMTLLSWAGWCGLIYWRFYQRQVDVLMLTYLCFSVITVVMFWATQLLPNDMGSGAFLILALLLIGMTSSAVIWLRGIANGHHHNADAQVTTQGADHE